MQRLRGGSRPEAARPVWWRVSATTRGNGVRDTRDFYETPGWSVRAILPRLPLGGRILDPGCGNGAILRALQAAGVKGMDVVGIELDPDLARVAREDASFAWRVDCDDFLGATDRGSFDLVIGNPPYGLAMEFVQQALSLAAPRNGTVAMLLRLGWLASQRRAAFHQARPCDVHVLPRRPSFGNNAKGKPGTDSADYAWLVWGPGRGTRWDVLYVEAPA